MEYDVGALIRVINEVNDNIWLGDFDKAKEIIGLSLEEISKHTDTQRSMNFSYNLRKAIRDAKKDAKERRIEDGDIWVTKKISERIELEGLDLIDNIVGVLFIRLSRLREMLDYIIKSKTQMTLDNIKETDNDQGEAIQRRDKYRFAVRRFLDRWEVRAILENHIQRWDLKELKSQFKDFGLFVEQLPEGEQTRTFEVYSQNMYAEILVQDNQIEFSIRTIATEDSRQRIEKLVEIVMTFFVKSS
jgi:hypothetical protein